MATADISEVSDAIIDSAELTNEPSLERPSRDYLLKNFTKADLQKICRRLGLPQIWVTKEQLADKIMDNHYSLRPRETQSEDRENMRSDNNEVVSLEKICLDISNLKDVVMKKDNRIEELENMVKKALVTINKLNDRITTLEENVRRLDDNITANERHLSPTQDSVLLIGDNNLGDLKTGDFAGDCTIRTIPEATMDLAKSWVNEKLSFSPTHCIVYCGIHDLLDDQVPGFILDKLGSLISELKTKNEDITIHVCELSPTLDEEFNAKIDAYNGKLSEWCEDNGIALIKVNSYFKFGTGDVDELCLKEMSRNSGIFLNRTGTLRLLHALRKQCKFIKINKNNNKNTPHKVPKRSIYASNGYRDRNYRNPEPDLLDDALPTPHPPRNHLNPDVQERRVSSHDARVLSHDAPQGFSQRNYQHRQLTREQPSYREWEKVSPVLGRQRLDPPRRPPLQDYRQGVRTNHGGNTRSCHNCGEFNHHQSNCRFDHKLKCGCCGYLEHKSKMCSYI